MLIRTIHAYELMGFIHFAHAPHREKLIDGVVSFKSDKIVEELSCVVVLRVD